LKETEKSELADVMNYSYRYENDVICKKGAIAETYYLIKSGEVVCENQGVKICTLKAGQAFGEQALYHMARRQLDVIVESEHIELLELTRENMQNKLKCKNVKKYIFQNYLQWGFEKSKYFRKLNRSLIEMIKEKMMLREYEKGDVLLTNDDRLKKLYFLVEGELKFEFDEPERNNLRIQKGYNFGEDFLFPKS
jgi:CRP-like cAMP-binding protein